MVKKYIDNVYIYMLIAFLFSLLVRYIYILQVGDNSAMYWNNQIMINTNDGYYWAEGARDILNGVKSHYLSPIDYAPSMITAFFAKILPFSFETVILYISAFLSSLVVIPIILIGKYLGNIKMGFIAALLASIAWSYYNRTMIGYYDTDMLNIVFPAIILSSLVWGYNTKNRVALLIIGLDILVYRWWYPQSYSLDLSVWIMVLVYAVYQYFNDEDYDFSVEILVFMMLGMLNIPIVVRLVLIILFFILVTKKEEFIKKYILFILIATLLAFFISGGLDPVISKIKLYLFRGSANTNENLHFYSVMKTIREANAIPFNVIANRISGNVAIFIISIIGYILLIIKHRIMLFALPMLLLGLLSYKAGLRFTIYSIVPLSLGIAYLIVYLSNYIEDKRLKYIFIILATVGILYPNIKHSIEYNKNAKSVFTKSEVKDLENLNKISSNKDFVLTWWDYGFPIRYYADVNTLIDGGKHHEDNYIISKIMQTPSPRLAYNLSILSVEKYAKNIDIYNKYQNSIDKAPSEYLLTNKDGKKYLENPNQPVVKLLMKSKNNHGFDYREFLNNLSNKNYDLPAKTRDIYLYMPFRMASIFQTVMIFGNIDLDSGNSLRDYMFYPGYIVGHRGDKLYLHNGIIVDTKNGVAIFGKRDYKIKYFIEVDVDHSGKTKLQPTLLHKDGLLALVYLKNQREIITMDLETFESMYVQMGLLGNYDKNLFELVISSNNGKIYKIKR